MPRQPSIPGFPEPEPEDTKLTTETDEAIRGLMKALAPALTKIEALGGTRSALRLTHKLTGYKVTVTLERLA
jgi:hypothetical protein